MLYGRNKLKEFYYFYKKNWFVNNLEVPIIVVQWLRYTRYVKYERL